MALLFPQLTELGVEWTSSGTTNKGRRALNRPYDGGIQLYPQGMMGVQLYQAPMLGMWGHDY